MENKPRLAKFDDCLGCMLCYDVCPKSAIDIQENENGFWMPSIDYNKCIGCCLCEKKCEAVRRLNSPINHCKIPLRAYNKNNEIRRNSTSGGVFAALAEYAIENYKAIVFGATLVQNKVYHIQIQNKDEIIKLQGSKYIQSNTKGIYKRVKELLDKKRFVLFSGTPCQVQALNVYLNKQYDNLLTVDLICHGVISNTIFKRHISINPCNEVLAFRDKSLGWGKDSYFKTIINGKISVNTSWPKNFFYHVFQLETCFRSNCYKCQFCSLSRVSDITLGDYWNDRNSNRYDKNGLSSILTNTEKGRIIISSIKSLEVEEVDWSSTIKPNPRLIINRMSYQSFSCSKHIGFIYRYFPKLIADQIVGTWYSKRNILFLPWFKYIVSIKKKYEKNYKNHLKNLGI